LVCGIDLAAVSRAHAVITAAGSCRGMPSRTTTASLPTAGAIPVPKNWMLQALIGLVASLGRLLCQCSERLHL